jgi:metallophosphoesterase (TIGR00282 family)
VDDTLTILMIGDVMGKPGMSAVKRALPRLIADHRIDFVVANGENTAGGIGITGELARELLHLGVNCITTGNHVWRQREVQEYIDKEKRLLRPYNFGDTQPGLGFHRYETPGGVSIGVINLAGRVFMDPADNPFKSADRALKELLDVKIRVVDFHAEATSEKKAMGCYLAGRVTAVVGTHTHVQTADESLLSPGTAYITDLGMTGPHDSVIGMRKDLVLDRFVNGMPHSFQPAKNDVRFQGAIIRVNRATGAALGIQRIDQPIG